MINDGPAARSSDTAMRDLLRRLERLTITPPARPNNPPPPTAIARSRPPASPQSDKPAPVAVGQWVLAEDPHSGDLVAQHPDGSTRVVASKGDH